MSWFSEAEARALRAKTPATMALVLWQRLRAAGVDPDLAMVPAYDLGRLYDLCGDYVRLTESVLLLADGDLAGLKRHALLLDRWATAAAEWTEMTAEAFNLLLDSLQLDADKLTARAEVEAERVEARPEEEPKQGGRYQDWHHLYERLDIKLESAGLTERNHRALARSMARIYEECLITMDAIGRLEKEPDPRFGAVARLLLSINTTWHFDLGPYHLGYGRLRPTAPPLPGLRGWLLQSFL